jgi:cytoskeletal protein CcmA (bactofilin family)
VSSAGDTSAITNQTLNGDGSTVNFTLDYEATAESILVSINGVLQTPGIDYTTTGTTLTFTTAPAAGDVIQVRFIAAITVISALINGTSNIGIPTSSGNVTIGSGGTANVLVVTPTDVVVTGNLTVSGNATLSGNILGDRIQNGTTTIDIQSVNGNANVTVTGTSNVAVFANTGVYVSGIVSVTGNITSGNLTVATGTVTAGNIVNANGNGVGNIGSSSTYFDTVFAKATSAQYADLAELYSADARYASGTVLSFGGNSEVTLTTDDSDPCVAGVVSTNPSYIMNAGIFCEFPTQVALTGRVPCRVVGTVTKGAMMVSAGNGAARAESTPGMGTVIGKALEAFDGESGIIEIVVGRL